jgi:hypothetical protein
MRRRRREIHPSEPRGDVLTLEREEDVVVAPSHEREPVRKPLVVPFEALPAKTVVSSW